MNTYEKTIKNKNIYTGKVVTLDIETVILPNDKIAEREIVRHPGAVAILPIDNSGNIYFVKQYRKAIDSELIEIPAGKLEAGEEPIECALRELQEEVGYTSNKLTYITRIFTSPGFADEKIYIFKAEDLRKSKLNKDDDEFINIYKYKVDEAFEMIKNGEITDAKTIIAMLTIFKL
ncbi:NUDIX hydrolase [Lutispora thermophila]|uniref:ADP-ribose pyrophosphatase n=1 Tax=Lutispora thermophila DSM 19022 TaxID=1122184 RepID=A0A1M6F6B6_9FIRM|nr:NUDIX hydrolase [Lutispora thermophila]SHI93220.1 ADP-ribose pyrophosphatase [Lutispora thermophila DSM 19022]